MLPVVVVAAAVGAVVVAVVVVVVVVVVEEVVEVMVVWWRRSTQADCPSPRMLCRRGVPKCQLPMTTAERRLGERRRPRRPMRMDACCGTRVAQYAAQAVFPTPAESPKSPPQATQKPSLSPSKRSPQATSSTPPS